MVPGIAPRRAASLPAAPSPSPAARAAAPRAAAPPPRRYPATAAPRRASRAVAAGAMAADASPAPAGAPKAQLSVAVFSSQDYVLDFLEAPFAAAFERATFIPHRFDAASAPLASGHDAVCLFVNDDADAAAIDALADAGVKFIAMRCAGFDRVDLAACARRGLRVLRVPTYSPRSVAEMALALAAARHLKAANARVGVGNFGLSGIVGLELSGRVQPRPWSASRSRKHPTNQPTNQPTH
jgi:D-lactate dehydrogenase